MLRWVGIYEKLFPVGRNYFMAYNEYDRRTRIATFHQLWFVRQGRLYERRHVRVRERAYSTADIRRMLRRAGLRLLSLDTEREVEGKPSRLFFLAGKPRPTRW
jgi:hypothetical protein